MQATIRAKRVLFAPMARTAPGPRGELLLGSLPAARKDPIKLFLTSAQS